MVFQFSSENVTRHNYKYKYNENCKPVFLKLCDIKSSVLKALQKHLLTNGLEEIEYKGTTKLHTRSRFFSHYQFMYISEVCNY